MSRLDALMPRALMPSWCIGKEGIKARGIEALRH